MAPFSAKPLATLTVGELLARARRERGWSAAELARATGVSQRFVAALEEDRHAALPGDLYVRQWLRKLAGTLHLNGADLSRQWFEERQRVRREAEPAAPAARSITNRQLRWAAAGALGIAALGFLGVRLYAVVAPPQLALTSPSAAAVLHDTFSVQVSGTTAPEAEVTVNGQVIGTAVDGSFSVTVPLSRGVNVISVSSRTKHSFSATASRVVTVERAP